MGDSSHIVCPHCDSINRVPSPRLGEGPKCGVCRRPLFGGQSLELTGANFQRHISRNDIPVLVDFWAPWCGPCLTMSPAFEQSGNPARARRSPWQAEYGDRTGHCRPVWHSQHPHPGAISKRPGTGSSSGGHGRGRYRALGAKSAVTGNCRPESHLYLKQA